MPKLAVNASQALFSAMDKEDLPIDFIKVPTVPYPKNLEQIDAARRHRPLLLHLHQPGILHFGADASFFDAETVSELLRRTLSPTLSTHVEVEIQSTGETGSGNHDAIAREPSRERLAAQILTVKASVDVPLLLENTVFYPWRRTPRWAAEPGFLHELIEQTDCGLLLDVAHARVTAWHFGIDVKELMSSLPLSRATELHVAGPRLVPGDGLRDWHCRLEEEDYELTRWVLDRAPVKVVTLEYGGVGDRTTASDGRTFCINRNDEGELRAQIHDLAVLIGK